MNEVNTNTELNTSTTVSANRIDEIAYNTGIIAQVDTFLLVLVVVILVCYILWKSLDNFISY